MTVALSDSLAFYAANHAALFPIPAGAKAPYGIVGSFKDDCSTDPAQWAAWSATNPNCNWGVVAGPSRWIIVDIDTAEQGRDAAWAAWCAKCAEWGIPVVSPHVQSARGGWHIYFQVPDDIDAAALKQPDAVKALVQVRAGNGYVVAAGSFYDGTAKGEASGPYVLLSAAPPYAAPAALIRHCTRTARSTPAPNLGSRDLGDVAALIRWLAEREQFAAYEDWLGVGMALKIEFGDEGLPLWQLTHDDTVTHDVERSKWESFATEPTAGVQTLATWIKRANDAGWRGQVQRSTAAMFGDAVAALAANVGATLPTPIGAVPMLAGQQVLASIGAPIIDEFLVGTVDQPSRPANADFPTLPDSMAGHDLFAPLRQAIERVIAMAESPKSFRAARAVDMLAVLSLVHRDTADAVCRRIRSLGANLNDAAVKRAALGLEEKVERAFVKQDNWLYSDKGEIENDNSDNVAVFLGVLSLEIRWNAWLDRAEIRGGSDPDLTWREWTYIDDPIVARLRTRGNRTKTRFRPGKDFFWESLIALAHLTVVDPALDYLAALAAAWDGTPRLSTWLSRSCGVDCDLYHQAVARNIIGGMVHRVRHPGCKHDTMPVFYGPQGTGKSTLARILAGQDEWFTDTIMLGDASKELVLSLAGMTVVEIGEMGMRGAANPNHVKAMISRQVDSGRTAYARAVTTRQRRNIFIGTTNDDEPLQDPTGNRRFLPVHVASTIDLAWLADNVAQLIGEAARLDAAGADFSLPREVWAIAAEHQERARSESDVETRLQDWFAPTETLGDISWITAADLVALSEIAGWRSATAQRGSTMKRMGFRNDSVILNGKRTKLWVRGAPPGFRPADIPRVGTRYKVGVGSDGRPAVTISSAGGAPSAPPPLPPPGPRNI